MFFAQSKPFLLRNREGVYCAIGMRANFFSEFSLAAMEQRPLVKSFPLKILVKKKIDLEQVYKVTDFCLKTYFDIHKLWLSMIVKGSVRW